MNARLQSSVVIIALAATLLLGMRSAQADELGARATWSQPTPAHVRGEVLNWLADKTLDATQQAKVAALWPAEMPTMSGTELLEQSAATFAIVDPRAAEVVKFCQGQKRKFAAPEFAILQDEATSPLVRSNLKLLFGRWLAQQDLFDESLAQLEGLNVQQVIDPASLLFYQSVGYHRVLSKDQALPAIARLLENEDTLPRRYASVAKLMEADLAPLKADSLDEIARLMDAIRVEMEHARAGTRVRKRQDEVISKLDKLIEELEKQRDLQQPRPGSSSGGETEIRLRLSPPELGSLKLEVWLESGVMTARLEVEAVAAQQALADNLGTLKQRLAEQNIRVEQFDIDLMDRHGENPSDSPKNQFPGDQREAAQRGHERGRAARQSLGSTAAPTERATSAATKTNLDVLI